MALTEAQKGDIRRFLYYPVGGLHRISTTGGTIADANAGYRYFQSFGQLEYRMNNLQAHEEARITGNNYASVSFTGPAPTIGDNIQLTFTGGGLVSPVTISVTAASDTLLTLCAKISQNTLLSAAMLNAGYFALAPYGTGYYAESAVPLPEVSFQNPNVFNLSAAFTGTTAPMITANGALLGPTSIVDPSTTPSTVRTGYLPILLWLEGAYAGATQNLDTIKADVWSARSTELPERRQLLNAWRQYLADFMGVPLNPNMASRRGGQRMRGRV